MTNQGPATFQAYYNEPYNAIVQPHRFLYYFRKRWMRELGPVGTAIVIYLRGLCYYNPDKNEIRNTCECRLEQIAEGIGVSRATVARELSEHAKDDPGKGLSKGDMVNPALAHFVSRQQQFNLTDKGVRRTTTLYHVSMDDPLHQEDQSHYELLCTQHSKRLTELANTHKPIYKCQETPIEQTEEPKSQFETMGSSMPPKSQIETGRRLPKSQIETTYRNLYSLYTNVTTLNVRGDDKDTNPDEPRDVLNELIDKRVNQVIEALDDRKSIRRHKQLVGICETHNLLMLIDEALQSTMIAMQKGKGIVRPGAYYQTVLLKLLENRGIHVPTVAESGESPAIAEILQANFLGRPIEQDIPSFPQLTPNNSSASGDPIAEILKLEQQGGERWESWQSFVAIKRQHHGKSVEQMTPKLRTRALETLSSPEWQRSLWRQWNKSHAMK